MSYEKQNGSANGRSVANTNTPKWAKGNPVSKVPASLPSNGSPKSRRNSKVDGVTSGEGRLDEEDGATPVKAFLSANITPRSGSRKTRVEGTSSTPTATPNGTPSSSRPVSAIEKQERLAIGARTANGLGIRGGSTERRSRAGSVVSDGVGSSVSSRAAPAARRNSRTATTKPESSPMFFRADDVKATASAKRHLEQPLSQDMRSEQDQVQDDNIQSDVSLSTAASPDSDPRPKFFYANDAVEMKSPPLTLANNITASRPQLQTIYSAHNATTPPRATSPLKEEFLPRKPSVSKPSPRRHTRLVSNGGSELKSPDTIAHGQSELSRRSSVNSPRQSRVVANHDKSNSINFAGPSASRRSSIAVSDMSPVSKTETTSLVGANGALPYNVNSSPIPTQESLPQQPSSQPQSPTKSTDGGQSKIDQMNELAANARRERKVLDLEISNSSLLAINRTLEREMRKQNAELRRFRRLSRTSRLSLMPSSRSASGKMSLLSEATDGMNEDFSLLDSEEDDDDADDILSSLSSKSTTSHPSPTARAARARFQDPVNIKLDLSAHHALLLDSQKLNQSIKRCLSHSETLIASCKEQLAYQAQPPEPENLGARVLTPDDIGDENLNQGRGLLSPGLGHHGSSNPWERSLGYPGSLDGGLETPDYSRWGPPTATESSYLDPDSTITDLETASQPNDNNNDDSSGAGDLTIADEHMQSPQLLDSDSEPDEDDTNDKRRASEIASLDGLDDSFDAPDADHEPVPQHTLPTTRHGNENGNGNVHDHRPPSPIRIIPSPDPAAAAAGGGGGVGNRGSMQGLGHYLQAFSIFGGSGTSQSA